MDFAGYALPRHLRVGRLCQGAILPSAGIVAGDSVAMYVVAAFLALGLSPPPRPPAMRCLCTGYVEDWQVTLIGARAALAQAGDALVQYISRVEALGFNFNATKIAVISDNRQTALRAVSAVGAPCLGRGMFKGKTSVHITLR